MAQSIDSLLATARSSLQRLNPQDAHVRVNHGALLVDIRPIEQRRIEGETTQAIYIERNVLEWRFDLFNEWHIPEAKSYDQEVIVLCSEGYTSSLAAHALQQLGFWQATDVEGGFIAWKNAGLPTQPGGTLPRP